MKKLKKKGSLDSVIEPDFSYVDELGTMVSEGVSAANPVGATPSIVSPAATFTFTSSVTTELGLVTGPSFNTTLVYLQLAPTPALTHPIANTSPSDQPLAAIDNVVYIEMFSNDPGYTDGGLWGMYGDATPIANAYGSQAGEAWAAGYTGSSKSIVGVIDTGIDYTHSDLYLNVWLNQGEISSVLRSTLTDVDIDGLITFYDLNNVANATRVTDFNFNGYIDAGDLLNDIRWENNIDENGNGYVDDLVGWDFANNDNDPFDDNSHGTHVSGTIGAIGGNGSGVAGVNWAVQMVGLKFLSATGSGSTSGAIRALDYFTNAATQASAGENFVATNNSWGGGGASNALTDAVTRAARQDILFVAAAGNSASNNDVTVNYPSNISTTTTAGYEAVIAVASLTSRGSLSSFSNFGATTVDLAAPGSSIYSTLPGNTYGSYSGTSMAAPHVAGAAALYASLNPTASAAQIQQALLKSAAPTTSLTSATASGGRLDIGTLMGRPPSPPPVVVDIAGTTATTATLTTSAPQASFIDVAGDQDWFKVELASGYRYDFALDAAAGSGLDSYLRLMDGRGTELLVNNDAVGLNSRLSFTASTTGTYFVSAQGSASSVGSYALNIAAYSSSLVLVGTSGNDILMGGDWADQLSGLAGNDKLDGGLGADTLRGGTGNDTYYVDNTGDLVIEDTAAGTDTVVAGLSYVLTAEVEKLTLSGSLAINATGNNLKNTLTGNAADNILDGGTGADTMTGGSGNDSYYVDNTGDLVIEATAAGTDTVIATVSYVLTAAVEKLTLSGSLAINATGNNLQNTLTGNAASNILNGGTDADTMAGGSGNDTYYVDNTGDLVIEDTAAGTDTVIAAVSYVLTADVEKLTLSGSLAINATGNNLNNTLTGNAADNILDGGMGADTMAGGSGNDTYYVDHAADQVTEQSAAGTDTVLASVSYVLSRHVENLTLNNLAAINATGNAENNTLTGNAENNTLTGLAGNDTLLGGNGNDTLYGGLGNDILNGGSGLDVLVFNEILSSTHIDQIVNFSAADDTIWLGKRYFKAFTASGKIADEAFNFGSAATQSDDRIIYNKQTGALLYDADGLGGAVAMQFAQLSGLTDSLSASDFYVI